MFGDEFDEVVPPLVDLGTFLVTEAPTTLEVSTLNYQQPFASVLTRLSS